MRLMPFLMWTYITEWSYLLAWHFFDFPTIFLTFFLIFRRPSRGVLSLCFMKLAISQSIPAFAVCRLILQLKRRWPHIFHSTQVHTTCRHDQVIYIYNSVYLYYLARWRLHEIDTISCLTAIYCVAGARVFRKILIVPAFRCISSGNAKSLLNRVLNRFTLTCSV